MTMKMSLTLLRALRFYAALSLCASAFAQTADAPATTPPPKSWIDPDTGHRVIRLTDEPGSDSFYFNFNAFTPDGKEMIYTTINGAIRVLNLETLTTRPLASDVVRAIVVGHKTPTIYYTKSTSDPHFLELWAANIDTGENRKIASRSMRTRPWARAALSRAMPSARASTAED
jgi:oligogalacturonide lyase